MFTHRPDNSPTSRAAFARRQISRGRCTPPRSIRTMERRDYSAGTERSASIPVGVRAEPVLSAESLSNLPPCPPAQQAHQLRRATGAKAWSSAWRAPLALVQVESRRGHVSGRTQQALSTLTRAAWKDDSTEAFAGQEAISIPASQACFPAESWSGCVCRRWEI